VDVLFAALDRPGEVTFLSLLIFCFESWSFLFSTLQSFVLVIFSLNQRIAAALFRFYYLMN
jgi:hypothetical protein